MAVNEVQSNKTFTDLYGDHLNNVVVFGDPDRSDKVYSHVKAQAWGEDTLSFEDEVRSGEATLENDVITLDCLNRTIQWYQDKKMSSAETWLSTIKWVHVLKSKPEVYEHRLKLGGNWWDFSFKYQPPLPNPTSYMKDGEEWLVSYNPVSEVTSRRPREVDGSIAIYHKTKCHNLTALGGKNYRRGKFLHLLVPKLTDAEDKVTWAMLSVDEDTGYIVVGYPKEFMDNAIYPVTINDNMGFWSMGGTQGETYGSRQFMTGNTNRTGYFPPNNGNISAIVIYANHWEVNNATFGLADDGGVLLADGAGLALGTSGAWLTDTLDSPEAVTTSDELFFLFNSAGGLYYRYDADDRNTDWNAETYSHGTLTNGPNPPTLGMDELISAYADVVAGGEDILRTVNDSLGVTDSMSRVATVVRTVAESMGMTDEDSRVHTAIRTVAESMGLTDTTIKDLTKVISDSIGITDAEARVCVVIRVMAESLGITDTASRVCEVYRTIAESLGITDTMSRVAIVERVVTETLGLTDVATGLKELLKTINDSMGLTDALAKDEALVLSESLGLTDSITRVCIVLRTIAESMGLTDVDSRVWEIVRTVVDDIGLTDEVIPVEGGGADIQRTVNDSLGVTDTTSRVHLALRVLSESLGLTDTIVSVLAINRIISDSVGITDGIVLERLMTVVDNLGITDDVTRLIDYIRTQDDDMGLIDSMVRVATVARTINESLGLTDEVSGQLSGLVKAAWAFIVMRQTHN